MKKIFVLFFNVIMALAVFSQQDFSKYVEEYNRAAFRIYNQLFTGHKNQVFSPFFLTENFAPLYLAAKGNTKAQIGYLFKFASDRDEFYSQMQNLNDIFLTNSNFNTRIEAFTGIFLEDSLRDYVKPDFLPDLKRLLVDTLGFIDMTHDFSGSIKKLNEKIRRSTISRLPRPIVEDQPQAHGGIFLVSSIEFTGSWERNFQQIYRAPFYLDNYGRHTKRINYMTVSGYFKYADGDKYEVVEIPYERNNLSLIVILPHKDVNIDSLKQEISYDDYSLVNSGLAMQNLRLLLPVIEIRNKFKLKDSLAHFMPGVFRRGANFSNMVRKIVWVDQVYQAMSFIIEPETQLPFVRFLDLKSQAAGKVLFINRPFIFIVKDNKTNAILFIGHVYKPL